MILLLIKLIKLILIFLSITFLIIKSEKILSKLFNFYFKNNKRSIIFFVRSYLIKIYELLFFSNNVFSTWKFSLYIFIFFIINMFSIHNYIDYRRKEAMIPYLVEDIKIDSINYCENYKLLIFPSEYEYEYKRQASEEFYKNISSHRKYLSKYQNDYELENISPSDYDQEINPELEYYDFDTNETYSEDEISIKFNIFYKNWKNDFIKKAYDENKRLKKFYAKYGLEKTYEKYCCSIDDGFNVATLSYNEGLSFYTRLDSEAILIMSFLFMSLIGSIIIEFFLIKLSVFLLKKNKIIFLILYFNMIVFIKFILPLLIFNSKYSGYNFNNLFENLFNYNPLTSFSIEPSKTSAISFLFPLNNLLIYLNYFDFKHIYILIPAISIHLIIISTSIFTILFTFIIPKAFFNSFIDFLFKLNSYKIERIIFILGIIILLLEILT